MTEFEIASKLLTNHIESCQLQNIPESQYLIDTNTLNHLVQRVRQKQKSNLVYDFMKEPLVMACGCMGADEGCMFCHCEERMMIYKFRFHINVVLKTIENV